ncbi:hypothetical protein [Vibrio owensii]|uniref:hypothetical protein n=1 Tax=Vibrio harveyi group TaxID=717610 RepID=UPI003CC5E0D8
MTTKEGYFCPIKGCECKKAWFPSLLDLTSHMIEAQGEEAVAKRLRVKVAEIELSDMEKGLSDAAFPHTVEVSKNSVITIREELDDSSSLKDFIDKTSNMEATFGFNVQVDFISNLKTQIVCTSS